MAGAVPASPDLGPGVLRSLAAPELARRRQAAHRARRYRLGLPRYDSCAAGGRAFQARHPCRGAVTPEVYLGAGGCFTASTWTDDFGSPSVDCSGHDWARRTLLEPHPVPVVHRTGREALVENRRHSGTGDTSVSAMGTLRTARACRGRAGRPEQRDQQAVAHGSPSGRAKVVKVETEAPE